MKPLFDLSPGDKKALIFLVILLFILVGYIAYAHYSPDGEKRQADGIEIVYEDTILIPQTDSLINKPIESTLLAKKNIREKNKTRERGINDSTLVKTKVYPGPPKSAQTYPKVEKLNAGQKIDLNLADTTLLKKVPGIGSAFANRIVKYRNLLGGYYYCKEQLQEVYGMDRDRYSQIEPYMHVGKVPNSVRFSDIHPDSFPRHPYISYKQKDKLIDYIRSGELPTWEKLYDTKLFNRDDSLRISPYIKLE